MQCDFDGVLPPQGFRKGANPTLLANSLMHEELFFIVNQNVPITLCSPVAERLAFICRIHNVRAEQLYPVAVICRSLCSTGAAERCGMHHEAQAPSRGCSCAGKRVPVALQVKVK